VFGLVPLAIWQIRVYRSEFASPDSPPDVEHFESDAERLDRLRQAALPARPEPPSKEDWPQWRGPGRDGISPLPIGAGPWPPAGPRQLWRVPGGAGYSSISISGGRAFTVVQDGEDEVILCLDAATGATRWTHRYRAKFFEQYAGTGPHGSPTVADGRVYVVGGTGQFHCLDAESGKVLWQHDLVKDLGTPAAMHGVSVSPLVDGDRLYLIHGVACAFDRMDCRLLWGDGRRVPAHSSPMLAVIGGRKQLVALNGEALSGFDPDTGSVLWSFPWAPQGNINACTPIIAGDYVFVASGYGKGCVLLEIGRGPGGAFIPKPVYEHNRMRSTFATPVLHQDHLYGFDESLFLCMEFRTGKIRWKQRGFGQGGVILAGNRLIVLGEEGKLALVDPSPDGYRELSSFSAFKTRCWAPPSVARGRMYVRDQESIACYDLESRP
jgi:outer membrane protein assembly factor BamB